MLSSPEIYNIVAAFLNIGRNDVYRTLMCFGEDHELIEILKNYHAAFFLIRKYSIIIFQKLDDYPPQPKLKTRGAAQW